MQMRNKHLWTLAVGLTLAMAAGQASATLLTNGNFETGDFTGWTQLPGSNQTTVISSVNPLAGVYSLVQTRGDGGRSQAFTAQTTPATASFIFTASDPGGATDRSMNVYFGQGNGSVANRVNLRLVDLDADGDGDIQVFDNSSWVTVLPNAVTFNQLTTLSLTFNAYGVGANYDLTVGVNTATNLTAFHGSAPTDFGVIEFVTPSLAVGSTFKVDNVVVVPEPGSLALLGVGGLGGLLLLRRRRSA